MRNIDMPIYVRCIKHGIKVDFGFDNTNIEFATTNINTAYKDLVQFTEAMYDEFNTPPIRRYKPGLIT